MSSKEEIYRAQLGEALVQIMDLQVELKKVRDTAGRSDAVELAKCRKSNADLTSRFKECNETISQQDQEITKQRQVIDSFQKEKHNFQAVRDEVTALRNQIKLLQKQIKG